MAHRDRAQIAIVTGEYEGPFPASHEAPDDAATSPAPTPTKFEQLYYIEQMALDLKQMADREGFETLRGIFDMAHREAQLRRGG